MFLSELNTQVAESIRVHHASGHFVRDEAVARLAALGYDPAVVDEILSWPVTDDQFAQHRTWPKDGAR